MLKELCTFPQMRSSNIVSAVYYRTQAVHQIIYAYIKNISKGGEVQCSTQLNCVETDISVLLPSINAQAGRSRGKEEGAGVKVEVESQDLKHTTFNCERRAKSLLTSHATSHTFFL